LTDGVALDVRLEGQDDLVRQIYLQLRAAILDGRLRRGERLPPSREMARRLDVSRNTAGLAYEWLASEGLLSGRRGAGTYVASRPLARATRREGAPIRRRAEWDAVSLSLPRELAPRFDFAVGTPDATLFPFDAWRRLIGREIRSFALDAAYGRSGRPSAAARGPRETPRGEPWHHGSRRARLYSGPRRPPWPLSSKGACLRATSGRCGAHTPRDTTGSCGRWKGTLRNGSYPSLR